MCTGRPHLPIKDRAGGTICTVRPSYPPPKHTHHTPHRPSIFPCSCPTVRHTGACSPPHPPCTYLDGPMLFFSSRMSSRKGSAHVLHPRPSFRCPASGGRPRDRARSRASKATISVAASAPSCGFSSSVNCDETWAGACQGACQGQASVTCPTGPNICLHRNTCTP
jgi:hypothetical protein